MKLVKMRELAGRLGVPISTFQKWVERDPTLSIFISGGRGGGAHWINVERLAGRPGISLMDAYMLGSNRWVKAVELAEVAGISRKTMSNWCRFRPGFAKRLGRIYYIDLEQLGAEFGDVEELFQRVLLRRSGQQET